MADAGGTLNVMALFRMSAANTDVRGFCSDLGQHTDEVLRSFGLADSEIGALAD